MTNHCGGRKSFLVILLLGACCYGAAVLAEQQQQRTVAGAEQQVLGALQAAQEPQQQQQQQSEESYQRVYEAFSKLIQNVSNNSLGNARRLVSRLNQLVGSAGSGSVQAEASARPVAALPTATKEQNADEKTEQILNRLDQVNKDTDQHTLRQLQEDVNRLVGTLSDSYLRNIRRLIERVDRVVGRPSGEQRVGPASKLHQAGDRLQESEANRQPGFPGWDELLVAVDRMQKNLAGFVRSSTKLITAGRR